MGKGDKKTKRGKIIMGSYGVSRPKKKKFRKYTPEVKAKTENTEKKGKAEEVAEPEEKK